MLELKLSLFTKGLPVGGSRRIMCVQTQICVCVLRRKNILAGEAFNVWSHQVKVNLMVGLYVESKADDRYVI